MRAIFSQKTLVDLVTLGKAKADDVEFYLNNDNAKFSRHKVKVKMNNDDLDKLTTGEVVFKNGVEFILQDIGVNLIYSILSKRKF